MSQENAAYLRVWLMFLQNGLIREMTFRWNFLANLVTRGFWFCAQLVYFELIFGSVKDVAGWTRPQYYAFMATGMLINAIIEVFFMPNLAHLSELIRTGNLDFALLKPIDTQFLISFEKVELGMVSQMLWALALLSYAQWTSGTPVSMAQVAAWAIFVIVGVTLFYGLMVTLACTSILFGRNQGLYDFWFYVTVFARYPRDIYNGVDASRIEAGEVLQGVFTWILPILLVVTVPAEFMAKTVSDWRFPVVSFCAAGCGLVISRGVFLWSLRRYRSAGS